jgi:2-dehydropantoate 2-reductase
VHILVVGAGTRGSMVAADLTQAGETVTVLNRGARASSLRASGLHLCGVAECTVQWTAVTDPRTVQEVDALVVAGKAYETASALAGLRHLWVQRVFSVQNGLLKHEQLASVFGAQKTIGAACRFAGEGLASGAVRYRLERERYLGPLRGQEVTPAQTLRHTLRHAGLQAGYAERMQTLKWSKCVGWLACTALAVLTRLETYTFLSNPPTARISSRVMREAGRLAAPGAPWKLAPRCPPPQWSRLQTTRRWSSCKASGRLCVSTPRRGASRLCKRWSVADASRSRRCSGRR